MFKTIRHLLELIRFSHTLFALPFALLAAVMAWYLNGYDGLLDWSYNDILALRDTNFRNVIILWNGIRWQEVVGILLCMVTARSAAMAFNRIADRHIDAENARTKGRHIPAGILSVQSVALFAMVNSAAFVLSTLLFLPNWLPVALSVPVLLFLLGYSYTKRFTSLAHFWLGVALMLAPISAWIAIRGEVLLTRPLDLLPAVTLGVAVLFWVAGFDIIYACQDAEFDRAAKLNSVPAKLGVPNSLRLAAFCHLLMIAALVALPFTLPEGVGLGFIYWTGISLVAALLVYEHLIVRPDDLSRVNVAFFNMNVVISLGLLALVTLDILL